MGLYAVLNERGNPIAYHENKRIIKDFLQMINKKDHIVVKVRHPNDIENTPEYSDLYLVKIGKEYIPSIYFDSADILRTEELYSYDSLVEIITRELEYNKKLNREEKKSLENTLVFFRKRIRKIKNESCDYESSKRFHELREEMNYSYDYSSINDNFGKEDS